MTAWLESGLVDVEYYSAVRGEAFADQAAAARDLVRHGMPERLSPHPRVDFVSLPLGIRTHWRQRHGRVVVDYLRNEGRDGAYGPLAATEEPEAARRHMIEVARRLAREARGPDAEAPTPDEIATAQAEHVDWDRLAAELGNRVPGRTSVVIPTYADVWMTLNAVDGVRRRAAEVGDDVEVVVVDNGGDLPLALGLEAAFHERPDVTLVRLPVNLNFAAGSNVGFAHSTGDLVVFLNNDTEVRRGWLAPLREGLEDPQVAGVQPLLLHGDDTIQTAGTVFLDDDLLPCHFLVGHPKEDALAVAGERFDAVTAAAVALRAEDVVALRGFDTAYRNGFEDVDLCLRLLAHRPGGFRVAPTALVTHLGSRTPGRYAHVDDNRRLFVERWRDRLPAPDPDLYRRIGFELAEVAPDGHVVPAARPRIGERVPSAPDRLRWSINLPSTAGHWGDDWGDTHFADALARGLRHLGQDVVTRRRGAHDTGPTRLDDVNLVIRGSYPVAPVPGKVNVLWVISHPDSVEPAELDGYDLAFAASHAWSAEMTERSGREVVPLLQATEATPPSTVVQPDPGAVFVGNRYDGRERPIVGWAVEAGVPLAVYGRGWEGRLPEGVWRGEYLDPRRLPEVYAAHEIVLADHWPDMARHGFVANRVFDAVAVGTPVVCDAVSGVREVFGPAVTVADGPEALRTAYAARRARGETDEMAEVARRVRREHSFVRRAAVLADAVQKLRASPSRGRVDAGGHGRVGCSR